MEFLTKIYNKSWSDKSTWIINTPTPNAKQYMLYIQEIGHFYCQPDFFTHHEDIDSFFISLTIDGEATYIHNNNSYLLKKNDLIFTNCFEKNTYSVAKNKSWDMIWMHFNGINAQGYYNQYKLLNKDVINCAENFSCLEILQNLLDINEYPTNYSELLSSKFITDLMTEILIFSGAIQSLDTNAPSYIKHAINDIENHLKEPFTLDYFANTYHVSKFYFLKNFKKFTGYTPIEYVQITRINHAKKLLMYSNFNVTTISYECGFQNISHFISVFKNLTGITPLQFRKNNNIFQTDL